MDREPWYILDDTQGWRAVDPRSFCECARAYGMRGNGAWDDCLRYDEVFDGLGPLDMYEVQREPARAKRNKREHREWLEERPTYHRTVNGDGEVGRLRKKRPHRGA